MTSLKHGTFFVMVLLILGCAKDTYHDLGNRGENIPRYHVIEDNVNGAPVVVVGNQSDDLIVAFSREVNGYIRSFNETSEFLPAVMKDGYDNYYDIFGRAIKGPDKGLELNGVNSGMGFWFAFSSRYPGIELYDQGTRDYDIILEPDHDWLVPTAFVSQGAGFDVIQSLQEASFEEYDVRIDDPDIQYLVRDNDHVIIVNFAGEQRVYPLSILYRHEIVNDEVQGIPISVTHHPLTGTSKVWIRPVISSEESFGVSGFVYNGNMLAFDRATLSYWTQLEGLCVYGPLRGEQLDLIPHIETTWKTWRNFDRTPHVMTAETGFSHNYSVYPFGDYRTNHNAISHPLAVDDDRLPRKERVFCIEVDGVAKAYRMEDF